MKEFMKKVLFFNVLLILAFLLISNLFLTEESANVLYFAVLMFVIVIEFPFILYKFADNKEKQDKISKKV